MGRTVRIATGRYDDRTIGEVVDLDEVLEWEVWAGAALGRIRLHMKSGYVREFDCWNKCLAELTAKLERMKPHRPDIEIL